VSRLTVKNLTKHYGSAAAIDDVSFTVDVGEFVSLLGPSGCGKTTTLRCIAGFERPDSGVIAFGDTPMTDPASSVFVPPNRRKFGMVFQSYAVWPHMTVFDNVAYPLRIEGKISREEIRRRVSEQLATVNLTGYEKRYPTQLSGGQQQRVALARALVLQPRALLFDEPLSNLDAKLRERMRFELVEIQSRLGIPAVYVTHDQSEAMVMSDRIIVMGGGRVAQEGAPEHVYNRPLSRFVADFIGMSNFVDGTVVGAEEDGHWEVACPLGNLFCVSERSHQAGEKVVIAIRPEHIQSTGGGGAGGANSFSVAIQRRYFLGAQYEYFLERDGIVLRTQSPNPLDAQIGAEVILHVDRQRCRIVAQN
jgi:iron(III) transport system ATP-binding protein